MEFVHHLLFYTESIFNSQPLDKSRDWQYVSFSIRLNVLPPFQKHLQVWLFLCLFIQSVTQVTLYMSITDYNLYITT